MSKPVLQGLPAAPGRVVRGMPKMSQVGIPSMKLFNIHVPVRRTDHPFICLNVSQQKPRVNDTRIPNVPKIDKFSFLKVHGSTGPSTVPGFAAPFEGRTSLCPACP